MKLAKKYVLPTILISAIALIVLASRFTSIVEEPIFIEFKTFKEFRKACLVGKNGSYRCSDPIESEFDGNPNYKTFATIKYCRNQLIHFGNQYRDAFGDSVKIAIIGLNDTTFGYTSKSSDKITDDTLDFGIIDTSAKLDPTHIAKFENDSIIVSNPIFAATSIISLIANPRIYNFKKMRVSGFLKLEHERIALYLNRDDYMENRNENSINVNFVDSAGSTRNDVIEKFAQENGKFVSITGVFEACQASICENAGSLKYVTKISQYK